MKRINTKSISIIFASLILVLGYQNCSQTNFSPTEGSLSLKSEGSLNDIKDDGEDSPIIEDGGPVPENPTDKAPGPVVSTPPEEEQPPVKDIGIALVPANIHWQLVEYIKAGQMVELPEKLFFRFMVSGELSTSDKNCAGSCDEKRKVLGQSYCSPFGATYVKKFNEDLGDYEHKFSDLSRPQHDVCQRASNDIDSNLNEELLTELTGLFDVSGSSDTLVLKVDENSYLTFRRHVNVVSRQ